VNRPARSPAAVLAIIILSAVLLFFSGLAYLTAYGYLLPVAQSASTRPAPARPEVRHAIAAYSGLLLTLLLLILGIGLLLAYRIIRYARPRRPITRVKTTVVDAWAEAGKRAQE
jgi:4-amino-4-deoxy-L-arabinose transferase-like glycosyltransferase